MLRNEVLGMKKDVLTDLVEQMDRRLPNKPSRSLCELKLSTKDYESLCRWVKEKLTRSNVRLSHWKAGAIIFNVITEVARREAVGHRLWPIVADKFSVDVRSYLFPNNHPCQELKSLIQRAARELRLRHVFDDEENQSWYITTHLQFGFTGPNFMANLPEWLCGQNLPDAVKRLLAGQLASDTFRDLWSALRFFRRDWITEDQLRTVINDSPWVLPEWKEELIRLTREKLHLIDVEDFGVDADAQPCRILGPPRFEWLFGSDPVYKCELEDLKSLRLTAPHYHVFVGNSLSATIFRQDDGTYRPDRTELSLPAQQAQIDVRLVDADAQLHVAQLVELWDANAEVNAFELPSGKPVELPAGAMSTTKTYALLLSPDLQLEPRPDTWVRLGGRARRMAVVLRQPWNAASTKVVTSDASVLWSPPVDGRTATRHPQPSLPNIWIQLGSRQGTASVGASVRPVIRGLPEGAIVRYVRLNGRPVSFDGTTGTLSKIVISPEDAHTGLHFDIGLQQTHAKLGEPDSINVRCCAQVDITGAAFLGLEGWNCLNPGDLISSRQCRDSSFRVYVPRELRAHKVALMEGPRLLRWIGQRAAPFGRTYGMGAPLVVRTQPYNSSSDLLTIAKGIEDCGVIESMHVDSDGGNDCHLLLSRPISLSPDHCVIAWPCGDNHEAAVIDHSNIQVQEDGRHWVVTCSPCRLSDNSVVAIAFEGQWLGSACCGDVLDLLRQISELQENKHLVASLVCWLRLPVLLRSRSVEAPAFTSFSHAHPEAVLSSWLGGRGLPHSLAYDEGFDRRQLEATQLRELYLGWIPTSEQAQGIVSALGRSDIDPLGDVVLLLQADLPLVTGHIIRHWLTERGTPQNCHVTFYMNALRHQLVSKHLNGRTTPRQMGDLLLRAAESMKAGPQATADDHFVQHAIVNPAIQTLRGGSLTVVERTNLSVALQVASFRQYLAMCVLNDVERELQNR